MPSQVACDGDWSQGALIRDACSGGSGTICGSCGSALIMGWYLPIPESAGKVAGHGGRDAGLDIQPAGQLQVGEGLGAREGNGAVQDIALLAKDLEEFGKGAFCVLAAWERDAIPAFQQFPVLL